MCTSFKVTSAESISLGANTSTSTSASTSASASASTLLKNIDFVDLPIALPPLTGIMFMNLPLMNNCEVLISRPCAGIGTTPGGYYDNNNNGGVSAPRVRIKVGEVQPSHSFDPSPALCSSGSVMIANNVAQSDTKGKGKDCRNSSSSGVDSVQTAAVEQLRAILVDPVRASMIGRNFPTVPNTRIGAGIPAPPPAAAVPCGGHHGLLLSGPPGIGKTFSIYALTLLYDHICDFKLYNISIPAILADAESGLE